jgi:hypothetical protein
LQQKLDQLNEEKTLALKEEDYERAGSVKKVSLIVTSTLGARLFSYMIFVHSFYFINPDISTLPLPSKS